MRRFATLLLTLFLISCMIFTAYAAEAMVIIVPETVETSPQKSKVEAMLVWALAIAEDDSHGYSQANRYGPDYDCTSFVCTALMEGGFPLDHYLSTGGMIAELPEMGFTVYRKGAVEPQRGDILVKLGEHAEICMGEGGCVAAHQDYDGRSGDRTGHEIDYRTGDAAYGCPFCRRQQYSHILRYEQEEASSEETSESEQLPAFHATVYLQILQAGDPIIVVRE